MKKRLASLLLFGLALTLSCSDELSQEPLISVDNAAVDNFIRFVDFTVDEVRMNSVSDPQAVIATIARRIPEFEKRHGIKLNYEAGRRSSNAREVSRSGTDPYLAKKMVYYSSISASENEYLKRLGLLKLEVRASTLSPDEKSDLLTQITLNEKFVRYLDQEDAKAKMSEEDEDEEEDEECSGWWNCWGKCVAGIVGGAGTGALTFGFAGAAVGTLTLPVVGTVSAGLVGSIVGGVAGGLSGAAVSCD
jgi:hypothetical protein